MAKRRNLLEQARHAIQQKQFSVAEKLLRQELSNASNNVEAKAELALLLAAKGDMREAQQMASEVLKLNPGDSRALSLQGVFANAQRNYEAAETLLQRAIESDRNSDLAWVNLGIAQRAKGKIEESEKSLRNAIRLNEQNYEAHYCLALTLFIRRNVAEGVKEIVRSMEINPVFPQAYFALGSLLEKNNQPADAENVYRTCLRFSPDAVKVREKLALLLAQRGEVEEAAHQMEILAKKSGNETHWIRVGHLWNRTGRVDRALNAFRKAAQLAPSSSEAYYNIGEILLAANLRPKAIQAYRMAIRSNRADARPHNGLGVLLLSENRVNDAVREFQKACRLAPNFSAGKFNLALALSRAGKRGEAKEILNALVASEKTGMVADDARKLLNAL